MITLEYRHKDKQKSTEFIKKLYEKIKEKNKDERDFEITLSN
ncbi:MAG: hypothetical protein P1U46_03910 [Patescibacteria group bacterium]|nr:hypothetical protein [Patescibacteria group bacterium]